MEKQKRMKKEQMKLSLGKQEVTAVQMWKPQQPAHISERPIFILSLSGRLQEAVKYDYGSLSCPVMSRQGPRGAAEDPNEL